MGLVTHYIAEDANISSNDEGIFSTPAAATISLPQLKAIERLALSMVADLKTLVLSTGLEMVRVLNPLIERIEPRLALFPDHDAPLHWKLMGIKAHQVMRIYEISLGKDTKWFVLAKMR
ncbi:hypothetical protein G6011_06262 [Alternaria panax]|uniref:Uncharacterized protein n=1 Tax=Alternaria panax TaxID=48097 RepID=A0AAD4FL30_9PLEO|nr:hypothetical protein G6011_06262 [Alternaria panax]